MERRTAEAGSFFRVFPGSASGTEPALRGGSSGGVEGVAR